jgi:hypothetical protein
MIGLFLKKGILFKVWVIGLNEFLWGLFASRGKLQFSFVKILRFPGESKNSR